MADTKRGPKPKLTRELLITTALRIADTEGLDALSMRRLGAELGVDPMAAYRHLPNKKALLGGVIEAVLVAADLETDPASSWQEQFRQVAFAYRGAMLDHSPAVARLAATEPFDSPAALRVVEHGIAILAGAGVPMSEAVPAIVSLGQITSGSVVIEAFWREWAAGGGQVYLSPPSLPHPDLPVLSAAAADTPFPTPEAAFGYGLDAIVEHLEAVLAGADISR